ncbi:MAG TPA: efflux RND transporter periplasmic adaptor subunit [Xanthobacteraceae bacterium]|nr:efflux RND transporter periplasmic adaptor subunit [Xanthobacteraceae bacterium]
MKSSPQLLTRRRLRIIGALVVVGLVAFGVSRWSGHAAPAGPRPADAGAVPVTAAIATQRDVPEIVDAIGNVQSIDAVSVQPRVVGTIEKLEFSPGQDVKAGQELFLIDPRPYQAALDQAKAQLAHDEGVLSEAQMDLTRYQTLAQQKSIAGQKAQDQVYVVAQDKGSVELDQANVETAQLNLDYCHITAPISGRAGSLLVDVGNLVGPTGGSSGSGTSTSSTTSGAQTGADTLVIITQLKPIYASFNVSQDNLDAIKRNQAIAPLAVDAYSQAGKLLAKGKVTLINNQVNTSTGTVMLQATFANQDAALWPGEYVSVQLVVGMRRNVVTVPASAVMVGPNGDYVYVIGAGNKVKRVDVQEAARRGGISVISKGIAAGQKVVATGQYRLDDGTVVAVQQTPAANKTEQTAQDSPPAAADPPQ